MCKVSFSLFLYILSIVHDCCPVPREKIISQLGFHVRWKNINSRSLLSVQCLNLDVEQKMILLINLYYIWKNASNIHAITKGNSCHSILSYEATWYDIKQLANAIQLPSLICIVIVADSKHWQLICCYCGSKNKGWDWIIISKTNVAFLINMQRLYIYISGWTILIIIP